MIQYLGLDCEYMYIMKVYNIGEVKMCDLSIYLHMYNCVEMPVVNCDHAVHNAHAQYSHFCLHRVPNGKHRHMVDFRCTIRDEC